MLPFQGNYSKIVPACRDLVGDQLFGHNGDSPSSRLLRLLPQVGWLKNNTFTMRSRRGEDIGLAGMHRQMGGSRLIARSGGVVHRQNMMSGRDGSIVAPRRANFARLAAVDPKLKKHPAAECRGSIHHQPAARIGTVLLSTISAKTEPTN
ncbi:MAG: hypothetical protein DMF04_00380 [Verrucomicrobia bacterium]|nr:MAG: hypothetical protein DMF04_00380 [Verrucomicrobiota bacterium]